MHKPQSSLSSLSNISMISRSPVKANLTRKDRTQRLTDQTLPHILCLLEHNAKTAVTVSLWTACMSPTFCGFMGENNKPVIRDPRITVEEETKQAVFMPLWIWINTRSEYKLQAPAKRETSSVKQKLWLQSHFFSGWDLSVSTWDLRLACDLQDEDLFTPLLIRADSHHNHETTIQPCSTARMATYLFDPNQNYMCETSPGLRPRPKTWASVWWKEAVWKHFSDSRSQEVKADYRHNW